MEAGGVVGGVKFESQQEPGLQSVPQAWPRRGGNLLRASGLAGQDPA